MSLWTVIFDLVILLGLSVALGAILERFRQSAILGYLLAGTLAGPGALHLVHSEAMIESVAELGVALLLFTIGLEFSLQRLLALGKTAILGGTLQIVATTLVFAVPALMFGLSPAASIAVGLLVAPSSTACVLRLMRDRAELESPQGRNAVGVLLLQDLALVPMVVLMTTLGAGGDLAGVARDVGVALLFLALLVVIFVVTSRYVLPRAFAAVGMLRNREILVLMAVGLGLSAMLLAHELKMSPALGAFIAGMLLAESPFATQIRADIGALRILFVSLFFVSVGMLADVQWLIGHLPLVLGLLALVVVGKAVVVWFVFRLTLRKPNGQSLSTGVALAQIGEFAFMLAGIGLSAGAIGDEAFRAVITVALASLFITPLLVSRAHPIGRAVEAFLAPKLPPEAPPSGVDMELPHDLSNHVIVIGCGPAGQAVVQALQSFGIPVAILELNPRTVAEAQRAGLHALIGDSTQEEVLEHLHLSCARAIVITIPDHRSAIETIRLVATMNPDTTIVARVRYSYYSSDYEQAGAHFLIDEERQVGQQLGNWLLKGLKGGTLPD